MMAESCLNISWITLGMLKYALIDSNQLGNSKYFCREWIKRMAKIASELREKLYLHDFSKSTDFSEIVMACSRHCGDISEVA